MTASKEPGSTSRCSPSTSSVDTLLSPASRAACSAYSRIAGEMSVASTWPFGPTRRAASRVWPPAPAATSRTRAPETTPARSSMTRVASNYAFDPQGSVSHRLGSGGSVSEPEVYAAHGQALPGSSAPFGYKARWGYQTDPESGLLLLTHRYYDPAAGRFLTRDPI